jgi:hypothetical protein
LYSLVRQACCDHHGASADDHWLDQQKERHVEFREQTTRSTIWLIGDDELTVVFDKLRNVIRCIQGTILAWLRWRWWQLALTSVVIANSVFLLS